MPYSKQDKARDEALARTMYEGTTGKGKYAIFWGDLPSSVRRHWRLIAVIARETLSGEQGGTVESFDEKQLGLWGEGEGDGQ